TVLFGRIVSRARAQLLSSGYRCNRIIPRYLTWTRETKMLQPSQSFVVLMADDDEDDRLLAREALLESQSSFEIYFVRDGVELMHYLRKEESYRERQDLPHPNLILLDLNMPRKDGREVLAELKSDPNFVHIPVV